MTHYSWQLLFDRLEQKGIDRIVTLFKIGLQEMPRLERTFLNSSPEEKKKAREEILALFGYINQQMQKAVQDSSLSPDEFMKELRNNQHLTAEEWARLSRIPELIGGHHKELFAKRAFNTPQKRSPYFKV